MHKDDVGELLDRSWEGFREQLLSICLTGTMPQFEYSAGHSFATSNPASPASVVSPSFPTSLAGHQSVKSVKSGRSVEGETSDQVQRYHGDSLALLGSSLANMSADEVTKIKNRLRLRLGANSLSKLVSGKSLLDAVVSLGLTMYHEEYWVVL